MFKKKIDTIIIKDGQLRKDILTMLEGKGTEVILEETRNEHGMIIETKVDIYQIIDSNYI